jgi:hypothetical protein
VLLRYGLVQIQFEIQMAANCCIVDTRDPSRWQLFSHWTYRYDLTNHTSLVHISDTITGTLPIFAMFSLVSAFGMSSQLLLITFVNSFS